MLEKQNRFLEKDLENEKFFSVEEYDEKSKLAYENSAFKIEDFGSISIKIVSKESLSNLKDYIVTFVFSGAEDLTNIKHLMTKEQAGVRKAYRFQILEFYSIPKEEQEKYLEEDIDKFFERFRIH